MTVLRIIACLASLCGEPQMINKTTHPWNEFDTITLVRAKKRCGELYPKSPCVKRFEKTGEIDYRVVCGK